MGTVTRLVRVERNTHLERELGVGPILLGQDGRWWSRMGMAGEGHGHPGGQGVHPQQGQAGQAQAG